MYKSAAELAEHPLHHTIVDQGIINAADKIDTFDIATYWGEKIADHVPDALLQAADVVSDFMIVPGMLSGAKSLFREIDMLTSSETTFGAAWKNGIAPTVARSGLVAAGLSLDAACGGMTFGLFTIGGYFLGKLIKDAGPKEDIDSDLDLLKPYLQQIGDRKKQALLAVNDSVARNFAALPGAIKDCPKLVDETKVRQVMQRVGDCTTLDAARAADQIRTTSQSVISALPKRNIIDKILGIDRSAVVALQYRKAADEVVAHFNNQADKIKSATSLKDDAKTVTLLKQGHIFINGPLQKELQALPDKVPAMARSYKESVEAWEKRCADIWTAGNENVTKVSTNEYQEVQVLTSKLASPMAPIRQRIRANLRRLGVDQDKCP